MTDKNEIRKPRGKLADDRADRLASELRANLRKRKALMRSRSQAIGDPAQVADDLAKKEDGAGK